MPHSSLMPVFDGHNDVLLRLMRGKIPPEQAFLEGDNIGHLDWPRMKQGGFVGGFFAVYVPSESAGVDIDTLMTHTQYDVPLPSAAAAGLEPAGHAAYGSTPHAHRAGLEGRGEDLPQCGRHPPLHRHGQARRHPAYRGRGGHRSGPLHARRALRERAALHRPGLEPPQHLRPRRAVPLSRRRRTPAPASPTAASSWCAPATASRSCSTSRI